jgi:hypothetical protein
MRGELEFTLPDVARLLGERQHRLIHLCERKVIVPDLADAEGRGSSRRFSRRNLLEFAVALQLRRMMLPVTAAALVIRVLRSFEQYVRREIPRFSLPESLRASAAPDLRVILSDGRTIFFTLTRDSGGVKLFGGIDVESVGRRNGRGGRGAGKLVAMKARPRDQDTGFGGPEGSKYARTEVSVTRIAQDLPLDE